MISSVDVPREERRASAFRLETSLGSLRIGESEECIMEEYTNGSKKRAL